MGFKLEIDIGNAAMSTPEHIAGALVKTAIKVRDGLRFGSINDDNGNQVGSFEGAPVEPASVARTVPEVDDPVLVTDENDVTRQATVAEVNADLETVVVRYPNRQTAEVAFGQIELL